MSKQIVEYHIGRLKDKNPQARINSIQQLVLHEDPIALDALQEVYKNDPDEAVRKAAQDAGRELFLRLRSKSTPKND